jgi:DNA repair exonuclease SbcCD ATPase subunit
LKNLFSNSPLIIDVEELKKKIKQVNKSLEYLNNTKAEKQKLIDRIKHDAEQEINDLGDRIKNAFKPLNNLF